MQCHGKTDMHDTRGEAHARHVRCEARRARGGRVFVVIVSPSDSGTIYITEHFVPLLAGGGIATSSEALCVDSLLTKSRTSWSFSAQDNLLHGLKELSALQRAARSSLAARRAAIGKAMTCLRKWASESATSGGSSSTADSDGLSLAVDATGTPTGGAAIPGMGPAGRSPTETLKCKEGMR